MKTCFSEGIVMKQFGHDQLFWENPPPFQLTTLFLSNFLMTLLFVQILKTTSLLGGNYVHPFSTP